MISIKEKFKKNRLGERLFHRLGFKFIHQLNKLLIKKTKFVMKDLSIEKMEMVSGGVNWACVGAVAGGIGLLAWSLGVPVVGPLTAGMVLTGVGTTLGTVAMVAQCGGY